MPCCGKNRNQAFSGPRAPAKPNNGQPNAVQHRPIAPRLDLYFEYTGLTGLTVRGPITGRSYRFAGRGQKVAVDSRDGASLMAVPNLRTVSA